MGMDMMKNVFLIQLRHLKKVLLQSISLNIANYHQIDMLDTIILKI